VGFFPPFFSPSVVLLDFFISRFWAFRNKGSSKTRLKKTHRKKITVPLAGVQKHHKKRFARKSCPKAFAKKTTPKNKKRVFFDFLSRFGAFLGEGVLKHHQKL
jgi:hypothetical protein